MSVREKDNPELYNRIQEQNLLRQYDLLTNCIEIGLEKGIEAFDKYTLWALNYAAVANIAQFGGRFREEPIYVSDHIPPRFEEVPHQMDLFFSFIHENWTVEGIGDHPTGVAAYALWRLNWIHPFVEGNGRTARAACYYLNVLEARQSSAWQENSSRTHSGESRPLLCSIKGCRSAVRMRTSRCSGYGRLFGGTS